MKSADVALHAYNGGEDFATVWPQAPVRHLHGVLHENKQVGIWFRRRKTFLKHSAIYWSGRSRYLAFPRCWFIKQHLIHLHVQAIVDRRGAVRLRVRWRRRRAAVSMVTAPVTTVRHLATSAVCPVWCCKQNSGMNFKTLLVKEVTPGTWRSANLELVLHEWGFGSLGCTTDWSAP